MPASIFSVQPEAIGRLGPAAAVRFMSELLWAEASRLRIPVSRVDVSSWVTVPDGGVDGAVTGVLPNDGGLLHEGTNAFQVKTGVFRPWQQGAIRTELFSSSGALKENLGASVRSCMDGGGRYVLVCTGQDLTFQQRGAAVGHLQAEFRGVGYSNPRVDVISQNQLVGYLTSFPSLSLSLSSRTDARFQNWRSWSTRDQMQTTFVSGGPQRDAIEMIHAGLSGKATAAHIRVRGEAGIGKTRLVMEALSRRDLAPLVIYSIDAKRVLDAIVEDLSREDNQCEVLLVVDECSVDHAVAIWDRLMHLGPRCRLVTINNEFDSLTVHYVDVPPLGPDGVCEIIESYVPDKEVSRRWAPLCDGSPRVAHIVGNNLRHHPDEMLRSPGTANVWERYVAGHDDRNSDAVRERRRVLQFVALFRRFGYSRVLEQEARAIARKVEAADRSITWGKFCEIVHDLTARRLLQGEHTRYITPRLLHIKLWTEWWEIHGTHFDLDAFIDGLPPSLVDWFFEMFRYAAESQAATAVVKHLLGEGGPFKDGALLDTAQGAKFFRALTDASPLSAMRCLMATVGTWTPERLRAFTNGRRDVVWALERIAVWRALFPDAARLLLQLAEAENESWSNNATGVFVGLFSPGAGPVAPTEASPFERFTVLKEALTSPSAVRRAIGLKAADAALQTTRFTRIVGAEYQGLRQPPLLWRPVNMVELREAYERVWNYLAVRVNEVEGPERGQIVHVLLDNARSLYSVPDLAPLVMNVVRQLSETVRNPADIVRLTETVLHYDGRGLSPEQRADWERLRRELVGTDFASRLQRYVGMELLEDSFTEDGEHTDKAGPKIEALAAEALRQPDLLRKEMPWLMAGGAQNGFRFGYHLGRADEKLTLLPELTECQRRSPDAIVLSGYLRALSERDSAEWESVLDECASDRGLRTFVPELSWRGGLTDRAARRVLQLATAGVLEPSGFRMFGYGGVLKGLSTEVFDEWVRFLLACGHSGAVGVALGLYRVYYAWGDTPPPLPKELTRQLLTSSALFRGVSQWNGRRDGAHEWTAIAKRFLAAYEDEAVGLASTLLEHFGDEESVLGSYDSPTEEVLGMVLKMQPAAVWQRLAPLLGPPIDSRAFAIALWLREGHLAVVPRDLVVDWIEADVDARAWYCATFVPPVFPGEALSARELLARYGDRADVRQNLVANFSTEMWSGPESRHIKGKIDWLTALRRDESEAKVHLWLDEYSQLLEARLERAMVEEERED